jgi:hypothetical protein
MKFELNRPFDTDQSEVVVDPGLAPGPYRFRLIVRNNRGQLSKPAEVVVTVLPPGRVDPPLVVNPPVVVNPGLGRPVAPRVVTPGVGRPQAPPPGAPVQPTPPADMPARPIRPRAPRKPRKPRVRKPPTNP